jgi:hypothetical protein
VPVEPHLFEEAVDDADKILMIVDWLMRLHLSTPVSIWQHSNRVDVLDGNSLPWWLLLDLALIRLRCTERYAEN